jgi:peptidoglycan/LPS O-acetylase OafA/YrhL
MAALLLVEKWFHGIVMALIALALTIGYAAASWTLMESRLLGRRRVKVQPQPNSA